MIYMYDPPSGWQHGWPKKFAKRLSSHELVIELLNSGYTQTEIDKWALRYTRTWVWEKPNSETPKDEGYF